jgi:Icc protein
VIGRFPLPLHLVTGNHDSRDALLDAFGGSAYLGGTARAHYTVEYPEATIVVLDSLVPGSGAGRLGADQLAWLDKVLARRTDVPAVVCLHHPPIPVGIPFLDSIRLVDGEAMGEVIARHPHVARVLAGHLHRVVSAGFAGSMLAVAPSTYRQSELCMRADRMIGYLAEPTGFLLHVLTGTDCITHTVPVSHAAALLGGF